MSAAIYHFLHLTGVIMLFMGYGALLARSLAGSNDRRIRKLGSVTSGIGLLLILVAGFGLIARVHDNVFHGWILAKIAVWLVLGGLIVAINRKPAAALPLWWITLALGILAALFAYFRPF